MTEQQPIEERQKYVEAWNTTMTKIWQERIVKLNVFEAPRRKQRQGQPHLLDSLMYFPVKHDDTYMELALHFTFPLYGIYQDRGTGREKALGNPGDIGEVTKAGHPRKFREVRPWFSVKYYSSIMNMKDFMARSVGEQFVGMMSTTFENLNIKKQ